MKSSSRPQKVVKQVSSVCMYVVAVRSQRYATENTGPMLLKTYLKPILWAGIDAQKGIFKNQPQFLSKISMILNVITFENRAVGSLWGPFFKIGSQCANYHITHTILHKIDVDPFKG